MTVEASRSPSSTGMVMWHVVMSLDGFIDAPDQSQDWMSGFSYTPGIADEAAAAAGALLGGRRGYDAALALPGDVAGQPYGGALDGPVFVLTHHPDDAPDRSVTFLNCDIAEAVETGLDAAGGKNLVVFGADVARQCATRGLIDELSVHIVPVMLGDGLRLFDCPGIEPLHWERIEGNTDADVVDLRFRPSREHA